MNFFVVTLFPDAYGALFCGVTGRSINNGLLNISFYNPMDYLKNKNGRVDDRPYGGGPGMVLKYCPLSDATAAAKKECSSDVKVCYLSPQGKIFNDSMARKIACEYKELILVSGRYRGVDQRFIDNCVDIELSVGDYILTGGELASMIIIDSVARYVPGVLGNAESCLQETFSEKSIFDCPCYTRPVLVDGRFKVPDILLSGDHRAIQNWRTEMSINKNKHREL